MYFDEKFEELYDSQPFDDPDEEDELDYFSENEVEHRENSIVVETIRLSKKIEQRFRQMNHIIEDTIKPVFIENLETVKKSLKNNNIDDLNQKDFNFEDIHEAMIDFEDRASFFKQHLTMNFYIPRVIKPRSKKFLINFA